MTGEIIKALATLFPGGGVVELRALSARGVHSGYFDDFAALAEKAANLDVLPDVGGVYVTLNEVDPALLSRRANRVQMDIGRKDPTTGDSDVLRRRWLPVDLDPVRPSGVSSTDAEHEAALARAREIAAFLGQEAGWPDPVIADSGNGAHLLYRIDLPNDGESADLVKACLAVLDTLFSDGIVSVDAANYNAARIWKLYGTAAKKGDNTASRPHRQSRLLSVPGRVQAVPAGLLRRLAGLLPQADPGRGRPAKGPGIDLREWLPAHGIAVRSEKPWQGGTLFVLEECPFSSAHRDGAFAIQFPSGALYAGCKHDSCGGGRQRWQELRDRSGRHRREKRVDGPSPAAGAAPPPPSAAEAEARARAEEILRSGDPLGFLLSVFSREHVGDRMVAECLVLSIASQSVENTQGLHVAISGNSGKGKTHACRAMLNLLPPRFRLKGTVSDKALYYHAVQPGTVLLFDDVWLSDDLQEVLKAATANFREPIEHRTLTSDRQVRVCTIPPRCVWWLAKVEHAGDDQVMNRMLCAWIDDSADQDAAVLAHLKDREAKPAGDGEDADVLAARAMWEIIKEEVLHVRVPFAPRVHFSATRNRRNPGMLFDLLKCHARLFFLQRERDAGGSIVANREDFAYARRLFIELSSETGAQDTKQTRTEAAALETIAKMGLEVFSIRQLQEALGLSYYQAYRLLKGYRNGHGSYPGILDKCPAVSYIDAIVSGEISGREVRHREHYFSFDIAAFRKWTARPEIWLEEEAAGDTAGDGGQGPDICTFAPGLHPGGANTQGAVSGPGSGNGDSGTGRETPSCPSLHHLQEEQSTTGGPGSGSAVPCVPAKGANVSAKPAGKSPITVPDVQDGSHVCTGGCKDVQTCINGAKVTKPFRVDPLPGLLDHRDFTRVQSDLGRCDICNGGKAVFWCAEKRVGVCEGCYGRMVREWNRERGVV
ncbi:MAG: hypothetical protein QMC82_01960 [Methanolinea sp.]|nr:hypothetical protein [Methanolinea sp.]